MRLRGADREAVLAALEDCNPLPGTFGFAGELDGRLVRDVLGREPLFVARETVRRGTDDDPETDRTRSPPVSVADWAFEPSALDDPVPFPAGHCAGPAGLDRCWSLPDVDPVDEKSALADLREAIDVARRSLAAADDGAPSTAVAFSGGVDSALVATQVDGPLYVVGFEGARDVEAARAAADAMGRADDLRVVELDLERLERAVPTVARAIRRTDAMDVAIALPLYLVAEAAAADGYDRLAVGQGADELFGGYEKVARLDHRVDADTVRGAVAEQIATLPDQLPRDVLAIRAAGPEPVAPLLHDRVVEAALALPESLLVDGDRRKVALRRVAADSVPHSVAARHKTAVQYGSLVSRELDRLARRAGFKRRMDDHVGQYVRSRLE